jgi:AcrR family transcriptional regulator
LRDTRFSRNGTYEEAHPCGTKGAAADPNPERSVRGVREKRLCKGTVYVYFETKEKLFESMIGHISVPFHELLTITDALSGSAAQKLLSFLGLLYERIVEDRKTRELMRFVISEGHRFPDLIDRHHDQFIAPIIAKIEALLEEGVASGEFRGTPIGFPELVVAPILTTTVLRLIFDDRRKPDKDAFLRAYLDLMLHGLLAERT